MALKLSLLLQAVDRISAPVRRIRDSVGKMGDGVEKAARKVDRAGAPMSRLGSKAQALRGKLLGVLTAANRAAGPNGIDLLGKASDKAGYAVGRLLRKVGGLALGAAQLGAGAALGAGGFVLFDMFRTAGEFEELQLQLETTYGSATKAKDALAWVQKFSETTPYQLGEVASAFTMLADSVDPKNGTLRSLGDAAAARRKTLGESAEMFLDAQQFQFERLLEFGLRANQVGDKVTFSFAKNGKQMQKTVAKEAAAVSAALTEILDLKYGGTMAKKSGGFFGIISNLQDQYSRFLLMVANAGVFDKVKSRLEQILAGVQAMASDGRLQVWAEDVGKRLEEAFDWAWKFASKTNWTEVGGTIKTVAEGIWDITKALAEAIRLMSKLTGLIRQLPSLPTGAALGPLQPIIGLTSLAKGYMKYGGQPKAERPFAKFPRGAGDNPFGGYRPGQPRPLSAPRPRLPGSPRASADKVQVGGQAKLIIELPRQAKAKLSELAQTGDVPWSIQIARSNGGPA